MAQKSQASFGKELKLFGDELAKALKSARASKEFKDLEHDFLTGYKSISRSLKKALSAARRSSSTSKLKRRLKSVVRAGKSKGKAQTQQAQTSAAHALRKARLAMDKLSKNLKKNKP